MNFQHRIAVATRKIQAGADFHWYRFEGVGPDALVMTGCVSSGVHTRGPRKGRLKYDGPPQTVVVLDAEVAAEQERYERETGHCGECLGLGRVCAGYRDGPLWRPCPVCVGTAEAVTRDREPAAARDA